MSSHPWKPETIHDDALNSLAEPPATPVDDEASADRMLDEPDSRLEAEEAGRAYIDEFVSMLWRINPEGLINNPRKRMFLQLCFMEIATFFAKNDDYGDSFSKKVMGMPAHQAIFVRLTDKYRRIENLLASGKPPKVVTEALVDTLLDLGVYSKLCSIMYTEETS